ncbi:hypothetical protein OSB04_023678 [Centaurea solstitialis]|uniref:Uncharacterized protein n=1 Tax=Centaurea solstitialis TaxID=347529 RepID=A0AA38SWG2_9ASTR|nr:hypothetical protein OSB04_023678 [Centaurea solstitialis]
MSQTLDQITNEKFHDLFEFWVVVQSRRCSLEFSDSSFQRSQGATIKTSRQQSSKKAWTANMARWIRYGGVFDEIGRENEYMVKYRVVVALFNALKKQFTIWERFAPRGHETVLPIASKPNEPVPFELLGAAVFEFSGVFQAFQCGPRCRHFQVIEVGRKTKVGSRWCCTHRKDKKEGGGEGMKNARGTVLVAGGVCQRRPRYGKYQIQTK